MIATATQRVFEKHGHRIVLGDVLEVLDEAAGDGTVDLIFADPPYNIGKNFHGRMDRWPSEEAYLEWSYQWIDRCLKKLKPSGSLYFMCSTQCQPYFDLYLRNKLTVLSRIVWSYDSSGVQARRYFGSLYEPILFCVADPDNYTFNADDIRVEARTGSQRKLIDYRKAVPTVYNSTKVPGNVWDIPRVRYRMPEYEEHPTQKPVALLERVIKASSNPGDLVLDPFSGSFTTGCVAKQLGRHFAGVEINEEYVKIGLRRMDLATQFMGEALVRPPKTFEAAVGQELSTPLLWKE